MAENKAMFAYYNTKNVEQFLFYQIPKALFTDPVFSGLSCEAKVLYSLMLDRIRELLPEADIYVQSITPVRPEVSAEARHSGMYAERFIRVNNDLAALAIEKGCYFLDLWEVLADENGDLRAEYAQPDGYHLTPEGYTAWVGYLRTHVAHSTIVDPAAPDTAASSQPAAMSQGLSQSS